MNKLNELSGRIFFIIKQYPFVLLTALITSILFNWSIYIGKNQDFYSKIGFVSIMGTSLTFALTILGQRLNKKHIFPFIGSLGLIIFYFFVFGIENNLNEKTTLFQVIVCAVSFILSHLLVSFIAYYKNENETLFWEYNKTLFINIILTALFTFVLTGGIELAVFAIEKLFQIDFPTKTYAYISGLLSFFGSVTIFLLFTEKGLSSLEKPKPYPIVLKFFTQFILIPLLLVYGIILYGYVAKISIAWNLPKGWVTYLIITYSLVGILALLLVYPLKEKATKGWVQLFQKIFYYSLIPLIILLFIAIFRRVSDYGITENRYYVLLLAIWLTLITLYFIGRKKAHIAFIPKSLFVLGLISLLLPFGNVFKTAERSQYNQITKILKENKLLKNNQIDFETSIQDSILTQLVEKIDFFHDREKMSLLTPFINKNKRSEWDTIQNQKWLNKTELYKLFPNRILKTNSYKKYNETVNISDSVRQIRAIKGYDYRILFNHHNDYSFTIDTDTIVLRQNNTQLQLRVKDRVNNASYDLIPYIEKTIVENTLKDDSYVTIDKNNTHEFDLKNYHFKIYLNRASKSKYEETISYQLNGELLIKVKE